MKTIIDFIIKSSADPRATSLTVKAALLGLIPFIMQALDIACDFGKQCYDLQPSLFETIVSALADGTFYLLSLISVIGFVYGLGRKITRTIMGENEALK